jgi:hypothetical protein
MRRFLAEAKFHRQHHRLMRHPSVVRKTKAMKRLMVEAKVVEAGFYREVQAVEARMRRNHLENIYNMRRRIVEGEI